MANKRSNFDLSHYSFMIGKIGRLQTLSVMPVIAGDSFTVDLSSVIRLQPLRRDLVMDAKVDLYAFYVPHRHIYGDTWVNFIKQGIDETQTLPTFRLNQHNSYLGMRANGASTVPLWLPRGYRQIWNRYFRIPTDSAGIKTDANHNSGGVDQRDYGWTIARLKSLWTTGHDNANPISDGNVAVSSNRFNIIDLQRAKARYKTEVEREWFALRYNDILRGTWGSGVNIDADERPLLVARDSSWISGYDVDGTSADSLGTYSGKSAGTFNLRVPRMFFPEHGTLWFMASLRFPPVHQDENHYLIKHPNPSYKEAAGDYDVLAAEPPHELQVKDLFDGSSTSTLGYHPYGQWHRTHPNIVHDQYQDVSGFPFVRTTPTGLASRYEEANYNYMFQSQQLGDWRSYSRLNVDALRPIPTARRSIYAGV